MSEPGNAEYSLATAGIVAEDANVGGVKRCVSRHLAQGALADAWPALRASLIATPVDRTG